MEILAEKSDLDRRIRGQPALLAYFGGSDCGVCSALKPRVAALIEADFPALTALEIDAAAYPGLAAQYQVFTVPTVLVFFDGRETIRLARRFSVMELAEELARPYSLRFE